jgi:hypothetical protein
VTSAPSPPEEGVRRVRQDPKTGKDDADIKWAARANEDLKLPGLADPMLQAFLKMRTSTMLGGVVYKDLNESMIAARDKSWVGPLIAKLEAPMTPPGPKDKEVADDFRDQLFWQDHRRRGARPPGRCSGSARADEGDARPRQGQRGRHCRPGAGQTGQAVL